MAVKPVVMVLNRKGEATAQRIATALGLALHGRKDRVAKADVIFDNALDHARDLFAAGVPIIGVCAAGILIRGVAPLLADKRKEPPVISVADDGTVVLPLLGGHRGANRLAREIAALLNATAAVTTAGDLGLGIALDAPPPGYRLEGEAQVKTVMADLLAGVAYWMESGFDWLAPVAELPHVTVAQSDAPGVDPGVRLFKEGAAAETGLTFHAQRYVLGLGCARGADPATMQAQVDAVLAKTGIPRAAIAAVASIDLKADEPAILAMAADLDVPLRLFTGAELAAETGRLANPSDVVFAEVGCHGVAEGAALACAGNAAELVVEKTKTLTTTCAIARAPAPLSDLPGRSRGRLAIVGIGPGQAAWRTPEVSRLIVEAEELVGYGLYIDLLGPLAAGKLRRDFPLGGEEARCRYALEEAGKGKSVALVCSGDAGIYAMGALVFELLDRGPDQMGVSDAARRVEVICSPGVSALQGAAARAGAPLGHDFCAISLSDLLTPRDDIIKRLQAAAAGDFVIAFYNPVSKRRRTLLAEAREILLQHRPAGTPVMLASSLGRPEEHIRYRRLDALDVDEVDMLTVVLVGSSHSRLADRGEGPRMYTPRGYARKIDGDLAR